MFLRKLRFALFIFLSTFLLNSCYLLKQGSYIINYNIKAASIERILDSEDISAELKETFLLVREIKQYAVQSIGLKEDKNYTRYVEMDNEYLVDVVSACEKDCFKPYLWTYWLFGSFPYKGFFETQDALKEAERLRGKDSDVLVRKVDAFSTLGFFVDPLYSFMKEYSIFALASLIIHEQTHVTIFIKDEIQFNEELATFVGWEGALNFIEEKYGRDSHHYRQSRDYLDDWERYSLLIRSLYEELNELYEHNHSREYILRKREEMFKNFIEKFKTDYSQQFKTEAFSTVTDIPLNNAYILSFVRYSKDLEIFYKLYQGKGFDLKETVSLLKQVKKVKGDPKTYILKMTADYE